MSNTSSQRDFARTHQHTPLLVPGNGIVQVGEPVPANARGRAASSSRSGRLEAIKGLSLLLRALALLPAEWPCRVRILGSSGPAADTGSAWPGDLALNPGWSGSPVAAQGVLQQYQWADLLAFTSLRDNIPTVVLEGLAAGLPVLCLDHQGMADLVTEDCGIKVPVTTPGEVAIRLSETIQAGELAGAPGTAEPGCHQAAPATIYGLDLGRGAIEVYRPGVRTRSTAVRVVVIGGES